MYMKSENNWFSALLSLHGDDMFGFFFFFFFKFDSISYTVEMLLDLFL